MKQLGEMVKAAKKPFMIVGGSRWSPEACKSVADFAARAGIPVAASFRRAQLFSRRSSEFRRRSRHRSQSEARRAHQGSRPSAAGRRPHVGSAVVGLHADRRAGAEAEAGACASGRGRTRPRLSAGAGDPGKPDRVRIEACRARHSCARQRGGGGHRARGLSRLVRQSAQTAGPLSVWRGDVLAARPPAAGRDHLQRRRQLRRLDPPLLPLPPVRHPACADLRLDGLWRAGRGDGEVAATRTGSSSPLPATATSR